MKWRRIISVVLLMLLAVALVVTPVIAKGPPPGKGGNPPGHGGEPPGQQDKGDRGNNQGNGQNNGHRNGHHGGQHGGNNESQSEAASLPEEIPEEWEEWIEGHKILVCHRPPGNPANGQEIWIDLHGWVNGHLKNHDDNVGPCEEPTPEPTLTPCPPTPTPEPTPEPAEICGYQWKFITDFTLEIFETRRIPAKGVPFLRHYPPNEKDDAVFPTECGKTVSLYFWEERTSWVKIFDLTAPKQAGGMTLDLRPWSYLVYDALAEVGLSE